MGQRIDTGRCGQHVLRGNSELSRGMFSHCPVVEVPALALHDGCLVVASDPDTLHAEIDARSGKAKSLADSPALAQWLGIFPYLEPLALQALLLILAVFAFAHTLRNRGEFGHGAAPVEIKQRAAAGR